MKEEPHTRMVSISEILRNDEIEEAIIIYDSLSESEKHLFAERCASEIIRPIIDRINKTTGQENDPDYLAYCIQYAITKSRGRLHA